MSSFSEQGSIDPDNPKLDYTALPLSERAAKLGPLVSQGASEPVRPSPILRPVLVPKAIDEPARRTRNLDRRTALLSVAAAVAGVVAVGTMFFVTTKPASRQLVASLSPSETTGSIPQLDQGDVESQPMLAKLKVTLPLSQPATHEESQQLLQRFLQ